MKDLHFPSHRGLLVPVFALTLVVAAHAQFDSNLIVNGGAESGAGSPDGNVVAVPGWTTTGNATAIVYGAAGGFPSATDPGPSVRGLNFFAGGPNNANSALSQSIAVSSGLSTIDAGLASYALSAYLGGFTSQRDNATLTATFLSGLGATLGTASLSPVSAADRGNATGLLLRSATGVVPTGTRSIGVRLSFTRVDGDYNDGYADDASLILRADPVPEPTTWGALTIGACAILRRRCPR